jgi:sulfopyruvate decarboxylase alpha subunit
MTSAPAWAFGVCEGAHAAGCRDVVYVPDNPLSHVLGVFEAQYADVRLVLATREEEAFGIAAGLHLGGGTPAVMLQSSGLGNSLNALTSLLIPYRIPVLTVVSMRGDEGEWNPAQMPMGRAVRAILESIGLAHVTAASGETTVDAMRRAAATAESTSLPCACLLPKRLTATGPSRGQTPPPIATPRAQTPSSVVTRHDRGQTPSSVVTLTRLDATKIVVAEAGEAAIVASLGHPTYDLFAADDRPRNFYTWGSMGLASSLGLGLALARPDVRTIVLDGDGSLLMNLGSLATIGLLHPSNLAVVVMDNEQYATTGGQPTPTACGADLAVAAQAMRMQATTVRTEAELTDALTARGAPLLIVAKVGESAPTMKPPLDCVAIKRRFMAALGG